VKQHLRKSYFLFVAVFLALFPVSTSCFAQSPQSTEIVPKVEFLPNYLFHLFECADIWEKETSEYRAEYSERMDDLDRAFLFKHRKLLVWGHGRNGDLTEMAFWFPANRSFDSKEELQQYFEVLFVALEGTTGEPQPNLLAEMRSLDFGRHRRRNTRILRQLSEVYLRNYDTYRSQIWPVERVKLMAVSERLASDFKNTGRVDQWELALGLQFPVDRWELVLTTANVGFPNANDLSRSRYNFYYEPNDYARLRGFIDHEIGTNLLAADYFDLAENAELLQSLRNNGVDPDLVLHEGFESLAEYFKGVMDGPETRWQSARTQKGWRYDSEDFYQIYDELAQDGKKRTPREMLADGALAYATSKGAN
jgi:hypothetical protein